MAAIDRSFLRMAQINVTLKSILSKLLDALEAGYTIVAGTITTLTATTATITTLNSTTATLTAIVSGGITGNDSSFGVTGQAAAQGGEVVVTGGASSTSGNAGGVAKQIGGAPGATGVGGGAGNIAAAGGATSGSGGNAFNTAGAGTAGNANGGSVVDTAGAAQGSGNAGICKHAGQVTRTQTVTAMTTSATITVAALRGGLITANQAAAGAATYTMPTGTVMDAAMPADFVAGDTFDFSITNISTVAAEDVTVAGASGMVAKGNLFVPSNAATSDVAFATFRVVKEAANTYSFYRIG